MLVAIGLLSLYFVMILVQLITNFNLLGPTELVIYLISITMMFSLRNPPEYIERLPKLIEFLVGLTLVKFIYQAIVFIPGPINKLLPWFNPYPLSATLGWWLGSYLLYVGFAIVSYPYFRELKDLLFEPVDNGYQAGLKEAIFATMLTLYLLILFYNPALSQRPPIIAFIGHALAAIPLGYLHFARLDYPKQLMLGMDREELLYRKQKT